MTSTGERGAFRLGERESGVGDWGPGVGGYILLRMLFVSDMGDATSSSVRERVIVGYGLSPNPMLIPSGMSKRRAAESLGCTPGKASISESDSAESPGLGRVGSVCIDMFEGRPPRRLCWLRL